MQTHSIYLGLGSNQGDRAENLALAIKLLEEKAGTCIIKSNLYRTAAWGKTDQSDFYNQVVHFRTHLAPARLLQTVLAIEKKMGRERRIKWAERIIDIDILFYNHQIINLQGLEIPHPFVPKRNFVLTPMAEIAPDFVHPGLRKTIRELAAESEDESKVEKVLT